MPDYTVTPEQLQQLNVMIDQGGHIPSEVSDALAEAQIAQAVGNDSRLTSALNKAIEANKKSGKAWSNVQGWHDDVKDSAEPVEPPKPPTYTEAPVNPLPNDNITRYFGPVSYENPGVTVAADDGDWSFSDASGNIGYYGTVNGTVVINGGSTPVPVKKGDVLSMAPQQQFGMRPKFSYSLNKYK